MDKEFITSRIVNFVHEYLKNEGIDEKIDGTTELIGGESAFDSNGLVELCIFLEDLSDDNHFQFDWTSDVAMSKSRSMFRSAETLAEEFLKQAEDQN